MNCDFLKYKTITECKKNPPIEVKNYAIECGLDIKKFSSKVKQCDEMFRIKKGEKVSSKKVSSKKVSSKKVSSKKVSSKKSNEVICKNDEEIHPITKRCRKKCKENEERNKDTGRCRKKSGINKASKKPSNKASKKPSNKASSKPSNKVSSKPSNKVSSKPSKKQSKKPSNKASKKPSSKASSKPSKKLSKKLNPLEYLMNNDADNFKQYFNDNPNADLFYFDNNELLLEAIKNRKEKIVDSIVEMEMSNREKGKDTCYQIYSTKYLKLIESLSTPTKQVDFYAENWLFNIEYIKYYQDTYQKMRDPLAVLMGNGCFFDRRDINRYNCDFPKIRWQSGDPRQSRQFAIIDIIMNIVESFLKTNKLYNLDLLKKNIESIFPFIDSLRVVNNTIKFDTEKFITKNVLFTKEISKQHDIKETTKMIEQYINYYLSKQRPALINDITAILNIHKNNTYPEYTKNDSMKIKTELQVYNIKKKLLNHPSTNLVGYDFCFKLVKFLTSFVILISFLLDVYTILRIFKNIQEKPYYVYCYFGELHIENLLHYFTYIMKSYTVVIAKTSKNKNKISRCISFEPNEYVENSKEIRKLSGPVSFYKLKAIDKDMRPQYITLFGDRHGSDREQCKECNFDYLKYYKIR
jgi:hypothetical protein